MLEYLQFMGDLFGNERFDELIFPKEETILRLMKSTIPICDDLLQSESTDVGKAAITIVTGLCKMITMVKDQLAPEEIFSVLSEMTSFYLKGMESKDAHIQFHAVRQLVLFADRMFEFALLDSSENGYFIFCSFFSY